MSDATENVRDADMWARRCSSNAFSHADISQHLRTSLPSPRGDLCKQQKIVVQKERTVFQLSMGMALSDCFFGEKFLKIVMQSCIYVLFVWQRSVS